MLDHSVSYSAEGGAGCTTAGFTRSAEQPEPHTDEGESTASSSGAIIQTPDISPVALVETPTMSKNTACVLPSADKRMEARARTPAFILQIPLSNIDPGVCSAPSPEVATCADSS